MESQSDDLGHVTVSVDPEEQVNITTRNNDVITTNIINISEDSTSIDTADGPIKIDQIVDISPSITPQTARFLSGIVMAAGSLATTVAGGGGKKPSRITFEYIHGVRVER